MMLVLVFHVVVVPETDERERDFLLFVREKQKKVVNNKRQNKIFVLAFSDTQSLSSQPKNKTQSEGQNADKERKRRRRDVEQQQQY